MALGAGALVAWSGKGPGDAFPSGSKAIEMDADLQRGRVLPLAAVQRVNRWLYLAGELSIDALDPFVRAEHAPPQCPTIYYRLKDHNGGKDPTAPDCATRWKNSPTGTTFVTSDCIGGAAWGA